MAVYAQLKETTKEFGSETSMHGIPHLILAKTRQARFVWALVCLAAIGWFTYMLSSLITKYISYPVDVRINEVCKAGNDNIQDIMRKSVHIRCTAPSIVRKRYKSFICTYYM